MQRIRCGVVLLLLLLFCSATPARADLSIGIGLPHVSIGINLPLFPELVPVPGYPVYYAPRVEANYFFYDGMYWVFLDDYWYASYWYDGPWWLVEPDVVPVFILRIPVRYYRHPPVYFRGWRADAPPRWGHRWGRDWEHKRRGWDKWKRGSAPARAPLPAYQKRYSGDRYPRQVEQQQEIRRQQYRYQPRDKAVRQHFWQRDEQRTPPQGRRERQEGPRMKEQRPQELQQPSPRQQGGEPGIRSQPQQPPRQREPVYRERRQPEVAPYERQTPQPRGQEQRIQERERPQEPRGQGHGQSREEDRGRDRN